MSATTMGQVHENDWETIYDRRVDLLQEAACSGDLALLAAIRVQDKLEYGDFSKAIHSADEETKQTYREMETRLQEENKKTNAETDEVKAKMEKLKNNDKGQSDWEKMLDEATANGKKDSIERWDQLNKFGKDTIRKMKPEYRKQAVLVYTGGLRAVSAFISHAVYWLQAAWSTLGQWIEQAWAKVKEWAHRTAAWFTGAWNTVKGWFGRTFAADDLLNRAHQTLNNSQGLSDLARGAVGVSGLGDVAAKVQNMSLDNVTLVKRGSGWIMELPI